MKYFNDMIHANLIHEIRKNSQKIKISNDIKKGIYRNIKKGLSSYTTRLFEDFYKPVLESFIPELVDLGYKAEIHYTTEGLVMLEVRW